MKKRKWVLLVCFSLTILIGGVNVWRYLTKDDGELMNVTLLDDIKKSQVIEKNKVLLESKQVTKIIGYEETNKKEYTYKDHEFQLKMTQINGSDATITKIIKNTWNGVKENINQMGERTYYQVGTYEVAYGIDAKEHPLEIQSIDEQTGVVKIKEPTVSILYFSMPFDQMEFEVEDQTKLLEGKIKITKEFTIDDRKKLYEDLVKRAKAELEETKNETALLATKEAIRQTFKQIDEHIVIDFVK